MTTATLDPIADQIRSGNLEEAKEALDRAVETEENRVELQFLRGYMTEMSFDREKALSCYQEVLDKDPDHVNAKFRAASLADSVGDEEAAMDLYKSCVTGERVHVNALLNLAVLYEDSSLFFASERCINAVLDEHPNHSRAHLMLKSVKSSFNMMYDETLKREQEQHSAILDTPVSDFELSVRSRNCLRQMNIATLGDLLDTTEAELLAYKNFGETSLNEIRAMLEQKQLKLGEALPMADPIPMAASVPVSPEKAAVLQSSVSALELSVRSRKCLQRLGIATLGELVQRSEAELTATKNFGQTSLNEITRQLAAFGLAFRAS